MIALRLERTTSMLRVCPLLIVLLFPGWASAASEVKGNLILIGGGLQIETESVYLKFIELAGGKEHARIGILPTAGGDLETSLDETLVHFGVPAAHIQVIDILPSNAAEHTHAPAILAQIRHCTGLFLAGGIQRKAALALLGADGQGTPALTAIREVYERGGVIAGTSAGTAVQGDLMISSFQLPIDTLDFGLATAAHHRGVIVSRGLGLFHYGLVDQHFNDSDGRIARLCRTLIDLKLPLGFGIDEDTAMLVRPDGVAEVLGASGLTIVQADQATLADGPKGASISGVVFHYLEQGDTFDLKSRTCRVNPAKTRIEEGREAHTGNQIVTDLSQADALNRALTRGLVDNTADTLSGLLLRFNGDYGHGYRFTFSKTAETRGYRGLVDGETSYAALDVRVDVRPVALTLEPSPAAISTDPAAASGNRAVEAIVFRGILPTDPNGRFHPSDPLTRAEFADALVELTAVERKAVGVPSISDVGREHRYADEIITVVAAGLMDLEKGAFRPDAFVTRRDVTLALSRAVRHFGELAAIDLPQVSKVPVRAQVAERGFDSLAGVRPVSLSTLGPRTGTLDLATREDVGKAFSRYLDFTW